MNKKMKLNDKKTNVMIYNFTYKFQFSTRLYIENTLLEIINETKLLGTTLTTNLCWTKNTKILIKKAYARMQILRNLYEFNAPLADLVLIYIIYIRTYLEQSCVVWHSSLSQENSTNIERVQKVALRIILKEGYIDYKEALKTSKLKTLSERREDLCLDFALQCTKNPKTSSMFPHNRDDHLVYFRHKEPFHVQRATGERLKKSAIPYMQRLLNKAHQN